jgi:rSAM/selenodomain-associated transferase 2
MTLVSIIIPALNEADNILSTIYAAQRDYTTEEIEIIVVDGGSTDGTVECIPPHITLLQTSPGRAMQMNLGAAVSHGEILAFCHADSQLPVHWRDVVIQALTDPAVSGGTFQTQILPAIGFLKQRNKWVLPPDWRIMFGDQVQFMRRVTFKQVNGFKVLPIMEDVEMSGALNRVGKIVRIDPAFRVITSSRRFKEFGLVRQTLLNTLNMIRYLYLGVKPETIARSYRSSRECMVDNQPP